MKLIIVISILFSACSAPFSDKASTLIFVDKKAKEAQDQAEIQRRIESFKKNIVKKSKNFLEGQRLFCLTLSFNGFFQRILSPIDLN